MSENLTAVLETTAGSLTLEFFRDKAPGHVDNFVLKTVVPEPATLALVLLGFSSCGMMVRRRR